LAIAVMGFSLTSLGSTTQLTQVNSMVQQVLKLLKLKLSFLVRDQRLGANVASAQGPTGLGKYLMRSPTGEIIFVVKLCVSGISVVHG
jgi:hypothetical protein